MCQLVNCGSQIAMGLEKKKCFPQILSLLMNTVLLPKHLVIHIFATLWGQGSPRAYWASLFTVQTQGPEIKSPPSTKKLDMVMYPSKNQGIADQAGKWNGKLLAPCLGGIRWSAGGRSLRSCYATHMLDMHSHSPSPYTPKQSQDLLFYNIRYVLWNLSYSSKYLAFYIILETGVLVHSAWWSTTYDLILWPPEYWDDRVVPPYLVFSCFHRYRY